MNAGKFNYILKGFCYTCFVLIFVFVGPLKAEETSVSQFQIREGETLKFSVRWLGIEVGTAEARVKGIEKINGKDAYHIEVHAKSNSVIDLVYPVRDEHHSYVDPFELYSIRYEKIIQEGRYRADEVIDFDQEQHTALYHSRKNGSKKEMMIAKDVHDEISSGYWFRTQPLNVGDTVHIPAMSDEKNWDLQVKILKREQIKIGKLGKFDAFELEPNATFQGLFIRRAAIRGWISADDRRLPLMMKTKIPVLGTITVMLVAYEGGYE